MIEKKSGGTISSCRTPTSLGRWPYNCLSTRISAVWLKYRSCCRIKSLSFWYLSLQISNKFLCFFLSNAFVQSKNQYYRLASLEIQEPQKHKSHFDCPYPVKTTTGFYRVGTLSSFSWVRILAKLLSNNSFVL